MKFRITINGEVFEATVEDISENSAAPSRVLAFQPPAVAKKPISTWEPKGQTAAFSSTPGPNGGHYVSSQLPGTVIDFEVTIGQQVEAGDVLLILEAMKMENEIIADVSGLIKEILVDKGESVGAGSPLILIE